jgi:hypothetical protein
MATCAVLRTLLGPIAYGAAIVVWLAALQAQVQLPSFVDATIMDPVSDKELRGAAMSPDGSLVHVLVATATEGDAPSSPPLAWATVDSAGRVTLRDDTVLLSTNAIASSPLSAPAVDASKESGLVAGPDSSALIVHAQARGQLRLVTLGPKDTAAQTRDVAVGSTAPSIRRVVAVGERRFAVLGAIGASPFFAVIDVNGQIVARAEFGKEEGTLVGAAVNADGGAVVIAERGRFPEGGAWIARVSPEGAVSGSANLPGRPLDIARGADGTFVLLVQRGTLLASEVVLLVLAPDLTPRSERVLVSNQRFVQTFRAAPVPSGGFVLAGVRDRGRWLSRVDEKGAEVWVDGQDPRIRKDMEIVSSIDLVSRGNAFAVAYTAYVVEERRQRKVVRISRFTTG